MNNRTPARQTFPSALAAVSQTPTQLLQEASDYFAIGIGIKAAELAGAAIETMKSMGYAANNPQLADAYALKAAICTEVRKTFHGDELKQEHLRFSLEAYRSEIACRQLGCETVELAKAHYLYGRTLAADLSDSRGYLEIAKAMQILATISRRDQVEIKTPWLY